MSTRTEQAAAQVLAASKAPETEVIVTESRSALTRFAGNTIHQNVAEENLSALVRVVWQKRIGVASGNDMSPSGLRRLARQALDIAKHQPAVPDFPGLASKEPIAQVEGFSGEVTSITPAKRASAAAKIIGPAARKGATASGVVSQETGLITVANSRGAGGTFRNSAFEASAVIEKGSGAGYAGAISWVPSRVDVARVGKVALKKAIASDDARSLAPDNYTVILEPQAVADLIAFMGYMGFGAQDFLEGTSFLSSRMGQKVMHESVSIWDDGLDPAGMPMPFDYEGVPKRRVSLIENGMARGVVYDTHYAAKAGARSTGHALPPTYGGGPLPTNLFMAPGTSSLDEMVASTERGPSRHAFPLRQYRRPGQRRSHRPHAGRDFLDRERQNTLSREEPALHGEHAVGLLGRRSHVARIVPRARDARRRSRAGGENRLVQIHRRHGVLRLRTQVG